MYKRFDYYVPTPFAIIVSNGSKTQIWVFMEIIKYAYTGVHSFCSSWIRYLLFYYVQKRF